MPELITIRTVKNQLSLFANKAAEEAYKSLFKQIIKRSETPEEYRARVGKNGEREDCFTPEVLHDKIREICQAKKKGGEGYVVLIKLAFTTAQSVADLAQRLGLCQLAKHHGHKLTPAAEALGSFLGAEEVQIEASFCEAIRIAKEQKSVALERRAESTYAEYHLQKASGSGGRGIRLPLW